MEVQAEYSSAGRRPDYLRNDRRERKDAAATWREAISATAVTDLIGRAAAEGQHLLNLKDSAVKCIECRKRLQVKTHSFHRRMRPARLERATYGSGGRRSIQLNYGRE
jgi:hypothetical protein